MVASACSAKEATRSLTINIPLVPGIIGQAVTSMVIDVSLVIVYKRFPITSQQVMEFTAIELISGNPVINTLLKHDNGIRHCEKYNDQGGRELHPNPCTGWYVPGWTIERNKNGKPGLQDCF
jgi:hypothetical protein